MDVLAAHREKWREVPGGDDTDGRRYSSDLLKLPDAELLSFWDGMAANRASGVIGWIGPLYRDFTNGRRVLELGSGLGLDGLRFASQGAHWTFADIAADNLAMIERIAALKGLKVTTHLIGPDLSFDKLDGQFDFPLRANLAPLRLTPFLKDSLRLTPAQVRKTSPALLPRPRRGVLYAVAGGDESAEFLRQNRLIRDAWGPRAVPVCEALPGLNHFSVLEALVQPAHRLNLLTWELLLNQ